MKHYSGTYTLYPADAPTAPAPWQVYALKIRKDDDRDYWLSVRGNPYWSGNASRAAMP